MASIDNFNYQDALDRSFSPILFLGQAKLQKAKEDYHRQQALQDEARRRAEYMTDVDSQRKFIVEHDEARDKSLDTREANRLKREEAAKETERKVATRRQLYGAVGYNDVEPEKGTLEDDKKAAKLGAEKLKHLAQLQRDSGKEIEAALKQQDPNAGKAVLARTLSDTDTIGILSPVQRKTLADGTTTIQDVLEKMSSKQRAQLSTIYNKHLTEVTEQMKGERNSELALKLRDHQSKFDAINNAIVTAQQHLPAGVVMDAYLDNAFGKPAGAPPTAPPTNPADALKDLGKGKGAASAPPDGSLSSPSAPPVAQGVDAQGYPVTRERSWWEPGNTPSVPVANGPNFTDWSTPAASPEELTMRNMTAARSMPSMPPMSGNTTPSMPPNPLSMNGVNVAPMGDITPGVVPGTSFGPAKPAESGAMDQFPTKLLGGQWPIDGLVNKLLGGQGQPGQPATPSGVSQPQLANAIGVTKSLFGTLDQNYLRRVKQWYIQRSGMPPDQAEKDIQGTIEKAVRGDPDAAKKIRSVMAQARNEIPGGDIDFTSPMERGPMNMPAPVPTYNGPVSTPAY